MFMSPAAVTKRPKINVNRIFVIIPAAGLSTRMESDVNKQIMEIDGVSVIERTLGAFQKFSDSLSSSGVSLRAVVVTSEELVYRINGLCRYNKFEFVQQVVTGGKTRMESVWRGIEALADLPFPPGDNDIVFIHDGARCLVDQPTLERCLEGAMKYDICAAAVPVKSTIKQTKMDILDEIPSVSEEAPKKPGRRPAAAPVEEPVAPAVQEEPEEPENYLRAAFEDREPAAPSTPTFTSLTSLMESKKASEQSKIFAAKEEEKAPSPFEAPRETVDEDGYRMDKVFISDNPTDTSSNKNPVLGLGMDYISKLPSLADRLGGAVMGKLAKEEQKRNAAAEAAAKKKKEEAPKVRKKNTPYVRPDSPFKRIDINEITVDDDDEPEVIEEEPVVEEEVPNSPFKRIDTSKITVDDDDRPTTRPAQRPPVTRPSSAVRPAARPPVTRPASATRPAARPPVTRPASAARPAAAARPERPVPAGRPAARPATAERANQAGRPAAVGRPGSASAKSPFKSNVSPEVVSTPDRDELMEVQTPQVFRFDKLIQSYVNGIKHNIEATDDTSLAEAIHLKVHLVEGSYANIKITTKEDIDYAEMLLKRQAAESAT